MLHLNTSSKPLSLVIAVLQFRVGNINQAIGMSEYLAYLSEKD